MKILCFGVAKEIMSASYITVDTEKVKTVQDLRHHLTITYPKLSKYKQFMVAVNQQYATDDQDLSTEDEIAIIPPVSGG